MEQTTTVREHVEGWRGETLFSADGKKIGTVDEVFVDTETRKPEWLAVSVGLLGRGRRLVPVPGAERQADGVHVPYAADRIESTPEIEGAQVDKKIERHLYSQYGLRYSERRSDTGLPEAGGAPTRSTSKRGDAKRGDERTCDELYEEAKRLGIRGRSKMNKEELARAVSRAEGRSTSTRSGGQANPIEVQRFLEGVGYPTRKRELVEEARSQGAGDDVRSTLDRLPDAEFDSPAEVSEAIGRLR